MKLVLFSLALFTCTNTFALPLGCNRKEIQASQQAGRIVILSPGLQRKSIEISMHTLTIRDKKTCLFLAINYE
ncbi:MAG TPA: hypothetical protein VNJ01_00485 [Bacteriovoracaceae bacterium]|nr:hypothetical protein [Bacteriovoracaceae bacterium]